MDPLPSPRTLNSWTRCRSRQPVGPRTSPRRAAGQINQFRNARLTTKRRPRRRTRPPLSLDPPVCGRGAVRAGDSNDLLSRQKAVDSGDGGPEPGGHPHGEGLPDQRVVLDDQRAVANAGVMLPALLAGRLGIEGLVDDCVDLGDRPGAAHPGRKVMTLVSAFALGADCIDDCDVFRSGQTAAVLGHRVAAPSTLGTFLRSFTFGHVRQLDRVLAIAPHGRGRREPARAMIGWSLTSTASSARSMAPRSKARVTATPQAWLSPNLRNPRGHR